MGRSGRGQKRVLVSNPQEMHKAWLPAALSEHCCGTITSGLP